MVRCALIDHKHLNASVCPRTHMYIVHSQIDLCIYRSRRNPHYGQWLISHEQSIGCGKFCGNICFPKQQGRAVFSIKLCGYRISLLYTHTYHTHADIHTHLPSFSCLPSIVLINVRGVIQSRKSICYVY